MVCFQTKKIQIWVNFGGSFLQWMMLAKFTNTWSILLSFVMHILWTLDIVRGILVDFPPFWYFVQRKIWQPCPVESPDR
jgi:hypothetical protein